MDEQVPSEEQMRVQMFKTMAALERWALTSIDFMTADKQPAEQDEAPGPVLDYSSLIAMCGVCEGKVVFEDYERQASSPNDTCTCDPVALNDICVPPEVRAIYRAIHEARIVARIPGPMAPLDNDLEELRKQLDSHRKALAVVSVFVPFKDIFFGTKPEGVVQRLIGLKVCENCVGTGWAARDESCRSCGSKGYLKA